MALAYTERISRQNICPLSRKPGLNCVNEKMPTCCGKETEVISPTTFKVQRLLGRRAGEE